MSEPRNLPKPLHPDIQEPPETRALIGPIPHDEYFCRRVYKEQCHCWCLECETRNAHKREPHGPEGT